MAERRKLKCVRYDFETTSLGKLAAVAEEITLDQLRRYNHTACFADFRDAMKIYVDRELLKARIDEAILCERPDRAEELRRQLAAIL